MTSPIIGLKTVIYKVLDITMAKEQYTRAFEIEPYFDQSYYVRFSVGGYQLGLQTEEVVQEKTNVTVFWVVEDIEKEYKRFIEFGATVVEPPMSVGGPIMVATLKDPWRNLLGLIL